jgi:hypothetical protein
MNIANIPSAITMPAIMRSMPATRLAAYQIVWFENVLAVQKPYQRMGGTRSEASGIPMAMNTKPTSPYTDATISGRMLRKSSRRRGHSGASVKMLFVRTRRTGPPGDRVMRRRHARPH